MKMYSDPDWRLRTRGLCKSYGRDEGLVRAVDEIHLEVAVGENLQVNLTGWAVPVFQGQLSENFLKELHETE